jgi:hypothetical protein
MLISVLVKWAVVRSPNSLVTVYQTKQPYIPEDSNLYRLWQQSLKPPTGNVDMKICYWFSHYRNTLQILHGIKST